MAENIDEKIIDLGGLRTYNEKLGVQNNSKYVDKSKLGNGFSIDENGIISVDATGKDGTSITITSSSVKYQASSSGTTIPTGTWSTSIPSISSGYYLWTKTEVNYSDGTSTVAYSVGGKGATGSSGTKMRYRGDWGASTYYYGTNSSTYNDFVSYDNALWGCKSSHTSSSTFDPTKWTKTVWGIAGENGADGVNGADGTSVTVTSTSVKYNASTSGTVIPTDTWSASVPSVTKGQYLWSKTVVNYSDGKSTTTYNVAYHGKDGANGANGKDGTNGVDGTSAMWFTGTAVTGTSASKTVTVSGSKAGDMYLNKSSYDVYTATAANVWKWVCNIKGANGTNATTTSVATSTSNGLMSSSDKAKSDSLKALAFKDDATGSFTPRGKVSTPEISVEINTTTIKPFGKAGTLPSCTLPTLTTTVNNEILTISWTEGNFSQGELPSADDNVTVATGIKSATASTPDFTGTTGSVTVS